MTLVAILLAVAAIAALMWVATMGQPPWRAVACLVLGLAAVAPIIVVAAIDLAFVPLQVLWTGVPALLLLGPATRFFVLRRT